MLEWKGRDRLRPFWSDRYQPSASISNFFSLLLTEFDFECFDT